ncbi:hypothetical protein FHS18_001846 [Paenibacillus phyllosphaerae]|uniref:Copper amine oxidase N-terminal domain-containing protein n=1 Tax=Paenibacillus phyllosphaerae TaxID=274593 RepID=A0A7W5FM66_9BACL|nr:hypothetical protein [Paenibacillus phyllosphaerae]MBB3109783.1 hypothetical protein [Paenibacillus phyllosphaerae]
MRFDLWVNDNIAEGACTVQLNGKLLIPFLPLLAAAGIMAEFNLLSGKIHMESEDGESVLIGRVGRKAVDFGDRDFELDYPVRLVEGQPYVTLPKSGQLADFDFRVQPEEGLVHLTRLGFGQMEEIQSLLEDYYRTNDPKLFTSDNPALSYVPLPYETSMPLTRFSVTILHIRFESQEEAQAQVSCVRDRPFVHVRRTCFVNIRKELGKWKVAHEFPREVTQELPDNLQDTADRLSSEHPDQVTQLFESLSIYFKAMEDQDFDQAIRYTAPSKIRLYAHRNSSETLEAHLQRTATRKVERLLQGRLVYLEHGEAVILGTVERYVLRDAERRGPYTDEQFIYMELDRERWTFCEMHRFAPTNIIQPVSR